MTASQTAMEFRLGGLSAGSQPVETSEDAADSLSREYLGRIRRDVLELFQKLGTRGATADEVAATMRKVHNTTSPRVNELAAMGFIVRCDGAAGHPPRHTRLTRAGRPAFVYRVTAMGGGRDA